VRVVITGASSGIGAALARHYAGLGAQLGLISRRPIDGGYAVDVTDEAAMNAAAQDFMRRFGVPDLVIANAGISSGVDAPTPDLAKLRRVLDVNVAGLAATLGAFAPAMRDAGRGTLCGIASVAGFRGIPGSGAYSGSKAAVIAYLESLRVELHGSGVAAVTICPGYIATPMTAKNPYRMPFLLAPDKAARLVARAIARRKRFYVLPWPMALAGRILRVLPRWLFDRVFAGAKRKPRDVTH
jgi:short-subunit dehydrogenase